ncbi:hypothetical protein [Proteus cibi]|uniref:hypothetical protein n=1 Tax=Proteus cibi TaxID=2050966 RepID=UPI0035A6FA77
MKKQYKKMSIYCSLLSIVLVLGTYYWLKLPYSFSYQRHLATHFINNINNEEYEQAFSMTQRNLYTGKTLAEFKTKVVREIPASGYQFAYSFPKQTNGNRLRRWFNGNEVEMQDVNIEFKGLTDLRITLRHTGDDKWEIFYITSHAG